MPYAPGISYRGDELLFRGITGAADSINQGIQQWNANKAEREFYTTQMEEMAQLIGKDPSLAKHFSSGDPKEMEELVNFPTLSLSQMKGKLAATLFRVSQAREGAREEMAQQRHQELAGYHKANLELQRGDLLQRIAQGETKERVAAQTQQDSLGFLTGLTAPLPSPVPEEKRQEYLRGLYPKADPDVIQRILSTNPQLAERQLRVQERNARTAEAQARNSERALLGAHNNGDGTVNLSLPLRPGLQSGGSATYKVPVKVAEAVRKRIAAGEEFDLEKLLEPYRVESPQTRSPLGTTPEEEQILDFDIATGRTIQR